MAAAKNVIDHANLILHNGKIATNDPTQPFVSALSIRNSLVQAVGSDADIMALKGDLTPVVDLHKRTVIPGLNDSHLHLIRGGLNYNMELRWDGIPSLALALQMLKEQAQRTPPGQWVRVVGGWGEFQFAERRLPTLAELNSAAPDTPVFVLHLYCQAMLNKAALRAVGYTKDSPDPPGGIIERNKSGHPTGLLVAKPNAMILYATLAKGPKLPPEHQINSTRHFMRELNRLGVTSCIDAGGGFQNYPDDYQVVDGLHRRNELTVRIAYNLFTQKPTEEKLDFARWMKMTAPGAGSDYYRTNGAGEMLVFSAADFEDFLEARPDLPGGMESELKEVIMLLAKNKWPFRLHATYDESINRFLNVLEEVHREVPLDGLSWFFDHAETITDRNIERVMMLGGGIAVQHRMAFQGEYFVSRYGAMAAEHTPPIRRMLEMGVPVGAGTDATRVASYNPFACLYWLVSGKTCGGLTLYPEHNRLTRDEALLLYTVGSAGFSSESDKKGSLAVGQFADLAVLSADYFSIPVIEIKALESVLTIVGGKPVYATHEFQPLDPPALPVLPGWSPVAKFGGYGAPMMNNRWVDETHQVRSHAANCHLHAEHHGKSGLGGCMCWAF